MSEVVVTKRPLTRVTALALTDRIRKAAEQVWDLLLTAYEGRAHEALGYDTWQSYVAAEFDISRGQSYRLIDQARVTRALQEATGTYHPETKTAASHARDNVIAVSAREAAVLKAHLPEETEIIAEAVKAGASPVQAVREAVARHQAPKTKPVEYIEPDAEPEDEPVPVLNARPIPVTSTVKLERGDIQILVKYIEETDPEATARLITERELQIIRRWIGSVVSARQASQPLTEAARQRRAQEVEPIFKKAAAKR